MKKTLCRLSAVLFALVLAASFVACHDTPSTWGHHSDGPTYPLSSGGSSGSADTLTVTITGASYTGTPTNTYCLYGNGGATQNCLVAVNGDTLTAVVKDASGNTVTSGLTYQWLAAYGIDNDADGEYQGLTVNWVEISGATSATYAVVQASSRWDIKVRVTQGSNVYYPDFSNYVRVPDSGETRFAP